MQVTKYNSCSIKIVITIKILNNWNNNIYDNIYNWNNWNNNLPQWTDVYDFDYDNIDSSTSPSTTSTPFSLLETGNTSLCQIKRKLNQLP